MKRAFTLAEVLIVLSIIGIIVSSMLPSIIKAIKFNKPIIKINKSLDYDFSK